jgi:hypothetical protein
MWFRDALDAPFVCSYAILLVRKDEAGLPVTRQE